ncbi:exonuclease [Mesobacillus campisalis]|uniref:Exonuclease n=1 Tax=Mesobacillus campisalis TaxID=1408103 RepID=A0A0M2SUU5_9BACI|nr:exonuclease domain-containing protein [Mesobacillus campisalis]KKK36762.1 exonuclease [Mesobacillus campisalis]
MGMSDFIQFFRSKGSKLSSNVLAGFQGQQNAQSISFLRQLEKEMRKNDDLTCPLDALEAVVFDIETTGFSPDKGDKVISIGGVKMRGSEILETETFYSLVRTTAPLPPEIAELTKISDDELTRAPDGADVLMKFFTFVSSSILVAHHARHEKTFMQNMTWSLTRTRFQHRIIDTSFLTRLFDPTPGSQALEELCASCGIAIHNRHHALGDALMTAELWSHYLKKAQKAGYQNLHEIYTHLARLR